MKTLTSFLLCLNLLVTPALAQTVDETFSNSNTQQLSDREQVEANTYYHTGRAQTVLTEECARLGTSGCTDTSATPGRVMKGGLGTLVEEALPKLYAAMGTLAFTGGGMGGIGQIKMRPQNTEGATQNVSTGGNNTGNTSGQNSAQSNQEGESRRDYCMLIPMGGELAASAFQQSSENQISQTQAASQADAQKESLYSVARVHDARAKTANLQGGVYAATGACYVAMMATGADMSSPMLWVKMGAAGAMSMIFLKKAKKHKEYADSLRDIARKLPGAGDCNPLTQTQCFCGEPTSQTSDPSNWRKVCVPKELASSDSDNLLGTCSTLNSAGTVVADVSCACKATNSCLDAQLAAISTQIGFGTVGLGDATSLLAATNGSLDDATITAGAARLNAATVAALGKSGVANISSVLNPKNRDVAKELNALGVPAAVAANIASQNGSIPAGSALADAPLPSLSASPTGAVAAAGGPSVPTISYNGGSASRPSSRGSSTPAFVNPFAPKPEVKKVPAVQVETFAQEALAQAEITQDTSKGIFDIISNRYRSSAWSRFDAGGEGPAPAAAAPR